MSTKYDTKGVAWTEPLLTVLGGLCGGFASGVSIGIPVAGAPFLCFCMLALVIFPPRDGAAQQSIMVRNIGRIVGCYALYQGFWFGLSVGRSLGQSWLFAVLRLLASSSE
jgi:hypothetical protein